MPSIEEIYLHTDNMLRISGLQDQDGVAIVSGTHTVSIFKATPLSPDACRIDFTGGGVSGEDDPEVGQTIVGGVSTAWAQIATITILSGSWAAFDAAGYFTLTGQQGSFNAAEQLNLAGEYDDVATATADSTITVINGADTKILVANHGLFSYENFCYFEGTQAFEGQDDIVGYTEDTITIETDFVAERFTGAEKIYVGIPNGKDISLSFSSPYWKAKIPKTLLGLIIDSSIIIMIFIDGGTYDAVIQIEATLRYKHETDVVDSA